MRKTSRMARMSDSESYKEKKAFFDRLLTVYGRNTVYEALCMDDVNPVRLHLADSNKPAPLLDQILELAKQKGADVAYHSKTELSRISKNSQQDQGVALDIQALHFQNADEALAEADEKAEYIALEGVTNPQNLGMIIRSVCASGIGGLILPRKGCAKLDPLVIKASSGTLFRAPLLRCGELPTTLKRARDLGFEIIALDLAAEHEFSALPDFDKTIFVLGNESEGISQQIKDLCTLKVKIPMHNDVESLNVAVTASLIALRKLL